MDLGVDGSRVEGRELERKRNGQKQVASAICKDQSLGILRTGGQYKWGLLDLGNKRGCSRCVHWAAKPSRAKAVTIFFVATRAPLPAFDFVQLSHLTVRICTCSVEERQ